MGSGRGRSPCSRENGVAMIDLGQIFIERIRASVTKIIDWQFAFGQVFSERSIVGL